MIPHIEDLSTDTFTWFCKHFCNPEFVEISEKIDGMAMSVGKEDGQIWYGRGYVTKDKFYKVYEIPRENNYFKEAVRILDQNKRSALNYVLQNDDVLHMEFLDFKNPNVIDYKNSKLSSDLYTYVDYCYVLLFKEKGDLSKLNSHLYKKSNSMIIINNQVITSFEHFNFPEFLKYLFFLEENKSKLTESEQKYWKVEIKKYFLEGIVKNINSIVGGSEVEGIILSSKVSKLKTKIVDNISENGFTKKHDRYWKYVNLCRRGIKVEGVYEKGIKAQLLDYISELLNLRFLRTCNFKFHIKKKGIENIVKECLPTTDHFTKKIKDKCKVLLQKLELIRRKYCLEKHKFPKFVQKRIENTFLETESKLNKIINELPVIDNIESILRILLENF